MLQSWRDQILVTAFPHISGESGTVGLNVASTSPYLVPSIAGHRMEAMIGVQPVGLLNWVPHRCIALSRAEDVRTLPSVLQDMEWDFQDALR